MKDMEMYVHQPTNLHLMNEYFKKSKQKVNKVDNL